MARDVDEYVRLAVRHASDLPRLAALRQRLRPAMLASRLCDAPRFVRELEGVYRHMWARHVRRQQQQDGAGEVPVAQRAGSCKAPALPQQQEGGLAAAAAPAAVRAAAKEEEQEDSGMQVDVRSPRGGAEAGGRRDGDDGVGDGVAVVQRSELPPPPAGAAGEQRGGAGVPIDVPKPPAAAGGGAGHAQGGTGAAAAAGDGKAAAGGGLLSAVSRPCSPGTPGLPEQGVVGPGVSTSP